jgi:3-deoxy-D-arabino-heptulosonate 7-phosphate (DAHP) synthase
MQLVRKMLVNSSASIPFVSSAQVTINQHNFTAHHDAAAAYAGGARASESQLHQTRFAGGNLWG